MNEWTIVKISKAIAKAEGFYAIPGVSSGHSRPARNHNPGDLTIDTIEQGSGIDQGLHNSYVFYADNELGFAALRQQIRLMYDGSKIYNPDMTILEIAKKYTATDQEAWARIVAQELKVSIDTKLKDLT